MFRFHFKYFLLAVLLLTIEVLIALYVHDDFIRPFVGDVLVVILLYCLLRAFTKLSIPTSALIVTIFSFLIEILQYFDFVNLIGLGDYKLARIVIGTSFSWWDMICYAVGIIIVMIIENQISIYTNSKKIV